MNKQEQSVVDSVFEAATKYWSDEMISNLASRLETVLIDKDLAPWDDGEPNAK